MQAINLFFSCTNNSVPPVRSFTNMLSAGSPEVMLSCPWTTRDGFINSKPCRQYICIVIACVSMSTSIRPTQEKKVIVQRSTCTCPHSLFRSLTLIIKVNLMTHSYVIFLQSQLNLNYPLIRWRIENVFAPHLKDFIRSFAFIVISVSNQNKWIHAQKTQLFFFLFHHSSEKDMLLMWNLPHWDWRTKAY